VGIAMDIQHFAATPVGEDVRAQAEVVDVIDRRVVFEVRAWDNEDLIGEGTHTRFVIDVERFMDRVRRDGSAEE
jgi:predicted thioesterase